MRVIFTARSVGQVLGEVVARRLAFDVVGQRQNQFGHFARCPPARSSEARFRSSGPTP